ncbi:MAG: NADPH-dependent oxidoreductase [Bacteroidetes bacterium GWC2_33_15]|nr:MAG: NADPH-dependent oxidoreductase [Bacteroidetes bacterium GWA2_33_15]OFX50346.1 MAG: NADPH-dependent oxidoreductase [Bacteroidetes bacterium GWC2_33_15]OFX66737.1 MAG: NADPH-dependent oxidoreductase [Bacteroidetes bacterium GWB2_32_14]OFX69355.1 MAG: NADPH-dependent oxidoreductase [Bacteroidetes bacterium GWD2_33_33]HAN18675.1 NADPH-dependent oxidoreductase [Bacteroidales bacterium]
MLNTIFNHKSIRKFKNISISENDLHEILEAGTRASTTGNMQIYSIIVTRDEEMKKKLAPTHFNQPMATQAPVLLTFCADINRFNKWCKSRNAEPGYDNFLWFTNAVIDAMLVAQNCCIAAEDKGLGICYLGTTTYTADKIIEILNLPKGVVPITTVVMGYPDENPGLTDRLLLEGVVHYETYKDYSPEDIDRIYAEKEALDSTQKLLIENNKESLAQVFTDNRYKKADNLHFSKVFFKVLQEQGFFNQ